MTVSAMHDNVHHRISTTEDELNSHIKRSQPVNISHLSSATKIDISRVNWLGGIKAMHKPNVWFLLFQDWSSYRFYQLSNLLEIKTKAITHLVVGILKWTEAILWLILIKLGTYSSRGYAVFLSLLPTGYLLASIATQGLWRGDSPIGDLP